MDKSQCERATRGKAHTHTHNSSPPHLSQQHTPGHLPGRDGGEGGSRCKPPHLHFPSRVSLKVARVRIFHLHLNSDTLPHLISTHMVIRYEYLMDRMVENLPTKCQQTQTQTQTQTVGSRPVLDPRHG